MTRVSVKRTIAAPPEVVFEAFANIENLPKMSPDIVRIEFLTDDRSGVGTRFRETRRMNNGKEMVTELEVTERVDNERARMVADSHGTVWDTTFTVKPIGNETEFAVIMDARAHELFPKLLNPLMKPMFKRGIEKYADDMRAYCESKAGAV